MTKPCTNRLFRKILISIFITLPLLGFSRVVANQWGLGTQYILTLLQKCKERGICPARSIQIPIV